MTATLASGVMAESHDKEDLALTPGFQLIINPARNPDEDRIWILGLRVRITL